MTTNGPAPAYIEVPLCAKCREPQYSFMDRRYLNNFGQCWSCDRRDWQAGKLSLELFESREEITFRDEAKQ